MRPTCASYAQRMGQGAFFSQLVAMHEVPSPTSASYTQRMGQRALFRENTRFCCFSSADLGKSTIFQPKLIMKHAYKYNSFHSQIVFKTWQFKRKASAGNITSKRSFS